VYAMSGLASGIYAGAGSAMAAARSVANSVASTINSALKIHSPSRVTEESGEYTTEGLEVGMLNRLRNLKRTALNVAQVVTDNIGAQARFNADLAFDTNYSGMNLSTNRNRSVSQSSNLENRVIQVTVVSELDGRELGRTTTPYIDTELKRKERLSNRLAGER